MRAMATPASASSKATKSSDVFDDITERRLEFANSVLDRINRIIVWPLTIAVVGVFAQDQYRMHTAESGVESTEGTSGVPEAIAALYEQLVNLQKELEVAVKSKDEKLIVTAFDALVLHLSDKFIPELKKLPDDVLLTGEILGTLNAVQKSFADNMEFHRLNGDIDDSERIGNKGIELIVEGAGSCKTQQALRMQIALNALVRALESGDSSVLLSEAEDQLRSVTSFISSDIEASAEFSNAVKGCKLLIAAQRLKYDMKSPKFRTEYSKTWNDCNSLGWTNNTEALSLALEHHTSGNFEKATVAYGQIENGPNVLVDLAKAQKRMQEKLQDQKLASNY